MELLDHMVVTYLIFGRTFILFSIVAAPISFPPTVHKRSFFSASSSAVAIRSFFDNSHSNRCGMLSYCGFDLHFPDVNDVEHHVPVGNLYVFFGKMSVQIFCPFFNQIVWGFAI